MKTVTQQGKEYKFETISERQQRLRALAEECIQAISPKLDGLNATEIGLLQEHLKIICYSKLTFSAELVSQQPT